MAEILLKSRLPPSLKPLYPFASRELELPNGHRLHYLDEGSGPTLLMLHGNPNWSFFYRHIIQGLRDSYRCVAIDHLGCGLSDKPQDWGYRVGDHAGNVIELVRRLGLSDITLVGHDWGGAIGFWMVKTMPQSFRRLIVFNSAAFLLPLPRALTALRIPGIGPLFVRGLNAMVWAGMLTADRRKLTREARRGYFAPYNSWGQSGRGPALRRGDSYRGGSPEQVADARAGGRPAGAGQQADAGDLGPQGPRVPSGLSRRVAPPLSCGRNPFVRRRWPLAARGDPEANPAAHAIVPGTDMTLVEPAGPRPLKVESEDLAGSLRAYARLQPDAPALIAPIRSGGRSGWRTASFGKLDALVDRMASGLARAGVAPGQRVIFLARPIIESLAAVYALIRLRAVLVAIDPGMGLRELLRCIGETRADVLIAPPAAHLVRLLARGPFRTVSLFLSDGPKLWNGGSLAGCLAAGDPGPFKSPPPGRETGYIFFTSGSTGTAKPVSISEANLWRRLRMVAEVCGWSSNTRAVACFPSYAPAVLAVGGCAILPDMDFARPKKASGARIVEAVEAISANVLFASPVVWLNLVRHCERTGARLSTVRDGVTAGAPAPINLHRRLAGFLHAEGTLHTPYGATEALPITSIPSDMLQASWEETRGGGGVCVGRALPGMRLEVVRVTDEPMPEWSDALRVPPGEVGEIVAGGPTVSPRYVGLPEANALAKIRCGDGRRHRIARAISAGWTPTGALWFCRAEVRPHRRQQRTGRMLMPVTAEGMLNEHPLVFRAAVVRAGGSGPIVCCLEMEKMERRAPLTPAMAGELNALLAGTVWEGRIERYIACPALPVDTRHNSKIRRTELSAWASRRLRRGVAARV